MTSPEAAIRSGTTSRRSRDTSGCDCQGRSSCRLNVCGRLWRAMCSTSRKPSRRDQPRARAAVLERNIRRDRRPVHQIVDIGGGKARGAAKLGERLDRPDRRVLRRGHLVDENAACLLVDQDKVGVRAADIDADPDHRTSPARRGIASETSGEIPTSNSTHISKAR